MKEINDTKLLIPLLKLYPWAIPAIVILGILSSLAEGLGISLFIPFLQSLSHTNYQAHNQNLLVGILNQVFGNFSFDTRLFIIPVCIFGSVLLKNCLVYSNTTIYSLVDRYFDSSIARPE